MDDSSSLYVRASEAAGRGDKLTAKNLLDELMLNDPNNEQAWLLLSDLVEDLNEVADCLQHALAINPQDQVARQKYEEAKKKIAADANARLDLDNLDLTPLDGDKDSEEAEAVKAVAAQRAEEAKKNAPPDPNTGLDLDNLDLTPLYGDEDK